MAGVLAKASFVYKIPWYAEFFHGFPRYSISPFEQTSNFFNCENPRYIESLLVLALSALAWLALWLVVYIVYFCYFCITCNKRIQKQRDTRPLRWSLVILVLLASGFVALAVYGNEKASDALAKSHDSLLHVHSIANQSQEETRFASANLKAIAQDISSSYGNKTLGSTSTSVEQLAANVTSKIVETEGIQMKLHAIYTSFRFDGSTMQTVRIYDSYRWIGTLSSCLWLFLLCVLIWVAVGCKSKSATFVCVALSGLTLVLVWSICGVYLALTVGTADVCMDPKAVLAVDNATKADTGIFNYSLTCEGVNPLYKEFLQIHENLDGATQDLVAIENKLQASQQFESISHTKERLQSVRYHLMNQYSLSDCRTYSRSYVQAATSLCHDGLASMSYVLLAFAALGNLLLIIIFLVHTLARALSFKKAYMEVESQDMQVPLREQPRSDNPLYYRFSQISTTEAEPQSGASAAAHPKVTPSIPSTSVPSGLLHRPSPPPTYHSGDFYSTYGTSHGTLESQRHGNAAGEDSHGNDVGSFQ